MLVAACWLRVPTILLPWVPETMVPPCAPLGPHLEVVGTLVWPPVFKTGEGRLPLSLAGSIPVHFRR